VSSTEHSGKMKILAKLMKVWARKRFKVHNIGYRKNSRYS
jgi:hypothetical protein